MVWYIHFYRITDFSFGRLCKDIYTANAVYMWEAENTTRNRKLKLGKFKLCQLINSYWIFGGILEDIGNYIFCPFDPDSEGSTIRRNFFYYLPVDKM
jgi:hypothetical protein